MRRARPLAVVLRPLGLGDFLTGVPAYRAIARAFPGYRRVLAAPAALRDLARHCGAFDDTIATAPLEPLAPLLEDADVAIDLHGRGPASQRILLLARARRLISFACPDVPETAGSAPWRPGEHEVARWCRMLAHAGVSADPRDLGLNAPAPIAGAMGATIVHPGAASGSRRWPAERFAAIARDERLAGRRVLVTGGPGERALAEDVARAAGLPDGDAVAGSTSLVQLAALVAHADRVVCGDTGVAHLATAFGTPSVTLFGPTSPHAWGPPPSPAHRVLWTGTTGDPHGAVPDPGLLAISVDDIRRALAALGERRPLYRAASRPAMPTRVTTASGAG